MNPHELATTSMHQIGGGVRARVQIQVSHLLELAAPTLARLY